MFFVMFKCLIFLNHTWYRVKYVLGSNGFDWILILHHKRLDFADIVDSIRFDKLPDQTTHRNPLPIDNLR